MGVYAQHIQRWGLFKKQEKIFMMWNKKKKSINNFFVFALAHLSHHQCMYVMWGELTAQCSTSINHFVCTHAAAAVCSSIKRKNEREPKKKKMKRIPHGSYLIKKDLFNVIFFVESSMCAYVYIIDRCWVAPSSFIYFLF